MKNFTIKKTQASHNTYDQLQNIQNKSYERGIHPYSSLNKYNRSPYLQKVENHIQLRNNNSQNQAQRKHTSPLQLNLAKRKTQTEQNAPTQLRSFSNGSNYQMPKVSKTILSPSKNVAGFKLPRIDLDEISDIQKQTAQSATLQFSSTKKKRLQPLRHAAFKCVMRTKAGKNGKQTKINQDVAFIQQKLPFGLKCYCVCDGHGLNGHIVSSFIKTHLIKNLTSQLRKQTSQPGFDKMQQIIYNVFHKTNQSLLDCDINTELSGSTVVAVFQYKNKLFCFNVGDSRAIVCSQVQNKVTEERGSRNKEEKNQVELANSRDYITNQNMSNKDVLMSSTFMKIHLSKSHKLDKFSWKVRELSIDQKPERQDQKQRIIKNGGRVQYNRNQKGQQLGPLRVWMKDIQMPGLAMTRSFGDKAGLKAGTSAQPQIIQHEIIEQDKFVVVASDGIWEYLQNDEVMNMIVPFFSRDDIDMAAQKVIKVSTQIWSRISFSRDDITLIIIALNPPNK